jgi:hypothetical protein
MRKSRLIRSVFVLLLTAGHSLALAAASLPILYVEPFQPVTVKSSGFGPLHAISAHLHAHRVDANADALSHALVTSLVKSNVDARVAPTENGLPNSGWCIAGVFYSLDEAGHLLSIPFLSTRKSPDVQVTVTISDLGQRQSPPFAVIGTDGVLKGQGAPLGWNPYVVSARFVMHRIEGEKSLTALADQMPKKS